MCYKAGPRCPSVALLAIEKAEHKWDVASNVTERNDAMQEIMEAKHQYDLTVKGQKDIEALIVIARNHGDKSEITRLNERLNNACKERKELLEKSGNKDTNTDPKHTYAIPTSKDNPSVRTARLIEMVKIERDNLSTSQGWKSHMDTIAKFPNVSFENQILINAQNPNATSLNTYEDWPKNGRIVNHNSKAIWLVTPTVTNVRETHQGTGETRIVQKITGYRSVGTFDTADTVGEKGKTSSNPPSVLEHSQHLETKLQSYGYTVEKVDKKAISNNFSLTDIKKKVIYLSNDNDDNENTAGLIREISHIGLGHDKSKPTNEKEAQKRNIEALSLEYSLRKHAGIKGEPDFGFIDKWGKDNKTIVSAERISKAARFLAK